MPHYLSEFLRFCLWFVTGFFRIGGRGMRTELLLFMMAAAAIGRSVSSLYERQTGEFVYGNWPVALALSFILMTPPFIRRLHDQGKSAKYALVVVVIGGLQVWEAQLRQFEGFGASLPWWADAIGVLGIIVFYVLFLWPPSEGENRYGPNPRKRRKAGVADA